MKNIRLSRIPTWTFDKPKENLCTYPQNFGPDSELRVPARCLVPQIKQQEPQAVSQKQQVSPVLATPKAVPVIETRATPKKAQNTMLTRTRSGRQVKPPTKLNL